MILFCVKCVCVDMCFVRHCWIKPSWCAIESVVDKALGDEAVMICPHEFDGIMV